MKKRNRSASALAAVALALAFGFPAVGAAETAATRAMETKLERLFAPWNRPDSPGCAVGVFRNGTMLLARGFGAANVEHRVPNTPQTRFYVASLSKQFTAASIALLAQESKLSLDDEIRRFLPEMPAYQAPITIRHLLYHTSGIRDYQELLGWSGRSIHDAHNAQEVLALIARQKRLAFTPGERHAYSNSGYFLLAQIVERASGMPLREYARVHLFEPLGMSSTVFRDDRTALVPGRSSGYTLVNGTVAVAPTLFDLVGDGGVLTTVEDLLRWDQNLYVNRLPGGADLLQALLRPGVLNDQQALDYASGLALGEYRGWKVVGHSGAFYGFSSDMMRLPEQQLTAVCLCNSDAIDAPALNHGLLDLYVVTRPTATPKAVAMPAQPPAPDDPARAPLPPRLTSTDLAAYEGEYTSEELDTRVILHAADGALMLSARQFPPMRLEPTAPDTFRAGPIVLRFTRDAKAKVLTAFVGGPRLQDMEFAKQK